MSTPSMSFTISNTLSKDSLKNGYNNRSCKFYYVRLTLSVYYTPNFTFCSTIKRIMRYVYCICYYFHCFSSFNSMPPRLPRMYTLCYYKPVPVQHVSATINSDRHHLFERLLGRSRSVKQLLAYVHCSFSILPLASLMSINYWKWI